MNDPYASHLPVLTAVMNAEKPARVLEYGAGDISTPFFLERDEVKQLVSVEVEPDWRAHVAHEYRSSKLTVLDGGNPSPGKFDLIFIDDGQNSRERVSTIRHVLSRPHPTVVIHDADVPEYAAELDALSTDYSVFPTGPDTAVVVATNK